MHICLFSWCAVSVQKIPPSALRVRSNDILSSASDKLLCTCHISSDPKIYGVWTHSSRKPGWNCLTLGIIIKNILFAYTPYSLFHVHVESGLLRYYGGVICNSVIPFKVERRGLSVHTEWSNARSVASKSVTVTHKWFILDLLCIYLYCRVSAPRTQKYGVQHVHIVNEI